MKLLWGTLSFAVATIAVFMPNEHILPGLSFSAGTLAALPLAVSISSFFVLLVVASLSATKEGGIRSVSTASYLVSGPSAAAAFVTQFITVVPPPPFWMAALTVPLFLGSALFYYVGVKQPDEERQGETSVRPFSNV